jgi:predicted nucleotidyltransferase
MDLQKIAQENKIYEVVSGSHAYGLNTPESDIDTRGLFIAPMNITLSIFQNVEQAQDKNNDVQIFELRKYLHLLQQQNPNILELLWIPEKHILYKHPVTDLLIVNRGKLLSSKVKFTYAGYAMAQMKRLRGHQKWITNPQPVEPPALWDYVRFIPSDGVEPTGELAKQIVRTFVTQYTATKVNEHTYKLWNDPRNKFPRGLLTRADQTNPSYVDIELKRLVESGIQFVGTAIIDLEAYQEKLKKHAQYWEWKENRNEKRAVLEEETGYDCKHASHTLRLLYAVHTILKEGIVPVLLPEEQRKVVMEVKQGKWEYADVLELAEKMDAELTPLYEATTLPREVSKEFVDALYFEILEKYLKIKLF